MFEKATRKKFRFESRRGLLTTEDLWDLGLEDLDEIYIELSGKIEDQQTDSLMTKIRRRGSSILKDMKDIVEHIFTVKTEEAKKAEDRAIRKQKKEQIAKLIEKKKGEELEGKDIDDLVALYNDLDNDEEEGDN